jgi:two-component system, chemotaxis family, chemotaxis protein CheY
MRILIVDDSGTTRKIVRQYLEEAGYQNVDEAADGDTAWFKIMDGKIPFNLVISDWHMPKVSGLDLLRRIRTTKSTSELPVILVTAERKQDEVTKAIALGVNYYLVKPFEPEALVKLVDKIRRAIETKDDADLDQYNLERQRLARKTSPLPSIDTKEN